MELGGSDLVPPDTLKENAELSANHPSLESEISRYFDEPYSIINGKT